MHRHIDRHRLHRQVDRYIQLLICTYTCAYVAFSDCRAVEVEAVSAAAKSIGVALDQLNLLGHRNCGWVKTG